MTRETLISSISNPRVKAVNKLRSRKQREHANMMVVEGAPAIRSALRNEHFPKQLFYNEDLFTDPDNTQLVQLCSEAGTEMFNCSDAVFGKISYRDRPDGLLALCPLLPLSLSKLDLSNPPLLVVMESVEKPGNLGTILRSADAAGADAVIVCDPHTDIHNPNVVRSSMGALFSVQIAEASSQEAINWLKDRQVDIVCTTPDAPTDFTNTNLAGPCAVLLGTEHDGLTTVWLEASSRKVRIPMLGQCDSLNVAQAATLMLYEAVRQRGA